jgi:hypothetical protein
MMNLSEHVCMLGENSPAPELMVRMMDRMTVDWKMAAAIDGCLAWYAARTKCIFCDHEAECRSWLERPEALPEFCPNAKFFRRCAADYTHDRASMPCA